MNNDVICPYCNKDQEIYHDDGEGYEEDELHEQECGDCEKIFTFTTSILFYYKSYKADCLNGAAHKYKPVKHYPIYWPDRKQCEDCGDEVMGEIDKKII